MSAHDRVQERLFDTMLGEVEGVGPDEELVARTLARLARSGDRQAERHDDRPSPAAPIPAGPRWLWLAAVLAIGVVATLASLAQDERRGDQPAAPESQDPVAREPAQWIKALRDDAQRAEAVRALARGGEASVRAMAAALGDADAPRVHVLTALRLAGARAAAALPALTGLLRSTPNSDPLVGAAVATAATLAPFGDEQQRDAARRAVLFVAFVDGGPAAGPAGGPGGGPPAFRMGDVARLLHRLTLAPDAPAEDLLAALSSDSPYVRELAAELLRAHDAPAVREALRDAVVGEHPFRIEATWSLKEGFDGEFRLVEQYDDMIRLQAARTLADLADGEPVAAAAQVALLRMAGAASRRRAAAALARTRIDARDLEAVTAAVVEGLQRDDALLLRELVIVAGRLPDRGGALGDALRRLSSHDDPQVAARARSALRR